MFVHFMKKSVLLLALCAPFLASSQTFFRSELPTELDRPWEISYGPDGYLSLTEQFGIVSRVHPETGARTVVFEADDYFHGGPTEASPECPEVPIGKGTLGLCLHPEFLKEGSSFVYFFYSYNAGTVSDPETKFRVKRLTWDASLEQVVADTNLIDDIMNGYDHFGGRMMAVKQNGTPYLFFTLGDMGMSEQNAPHCYADQSQNPNNFGQDVNTQNGKIHRFNMDGSVPDDNPIPGNSFYTRGHRNPQGLMFNPESETLYSVEHGDRTDDEINKLEAGMNYGWKEVRGYHFDNNHPGEKEFIEDYVPHPQIQGDRLVEAFYSWCAAPDTSADWCTVAPSDGIYYPSDGGIPQFRNSLLVVTLKQGKYANKEVYHFRLDKDGKLLPSTEVNPNPKQFFAEDQEVNGRIRDIALSPDGKKIFLINNGASPNGDKISVYTYDETGGLNGEGDPKFRFYPNPTSDFGVIQGLEDPSLLKKMELTDGKGKSMEVELNADQQMDVSELASGIYLLKLYFENETYSLRFLKQ